MNRLPHNTDPAMLAMALDQSFNAVLMTDANPGKDGHRIVYVNAAFCRMTGYSEAELLGKNARLLQGPATNPDVIDRRDRSPARKLREQQAAREMERGWQWRRASVLWGWLT